MRRSLWIGDAFEKVNNPDETTRALISACIRRGWAASYAVAADLFWEGTLRVRATSIAEQDERLVLMDVSDQSLERFDYIFLRADPPFDPVYSSALDLMSAHSPGGGATYVNDPGLVASWVERLTPTVRAVRTLVTSNPSRAIEYASQLRRCVIKPLRGGNGLGVTVVLDSHENARGAVLESLRRSSHVVVQEFLNGITDGEARVWLVAGKAAAWARKRFERGTPVFEPSLGDVLERYVPTSDESAKATDLAERLLGRGCLLAAVDFIDGQPIDVNITSPGLMVEYQRVTGEDLPDAVITLLEKRRACS